MLITNHVLSGALLGLLAPDVASAGGLGLVSHFGLDAVPHFGVQERDFLRIAVPDGLVGLLAIAAVTAAVPARTRWRVLAGITGACLPDLDKPGRQFFGRSPYPAGWDAWHASIQSESPRRWPVELATAGLSLLAVRALLRRA